MSSAPVKQLLEIGDTARGTTEYWRSWSDLLRIIWNQNQLFQPRNLFQKGVEYTLALSKQSSIEQYPVKTFLDRGRIKRYLPTNQDGITITQK